MLTTHLYLDCLVHRLRTDGPLIPQPLYVFVPGMVTVLLFTVFSNIIYQPCV